MVNSQCSDLSKEDPEAWEKVSFTDLCLDGMNDPYANKFKHYHKEIKKISNYSYRFDSWALKAVIVKANDDIRQEVLAV